MLFKSLSQLKMYQLGSVVTATPKTYVGYAENTTAEQRRPSGTITSDKKLELIPILIHILLFLTLVRSLPLHGLLVLFLLLFPHL